MIRLSRPTCRQENGQAVLSVRVDISREAAKAWDTFAHTPGCSHGYSYADATYPDWVCGGRELWFSVDESLGDGLCTDRADCFVAALLYYAMATGEDIVCDAPVSETLLRNMNERLIPALTGEGTPFRTIRVSAEAISAPYPSRGAVGAAMSCGIDSTYTLWENGQDNVPPSYRLTHLSYFDVGAAYVPPTTPPIPIPERNEMIRALNEKMYCGTVTIAGECGLTPVYVSSNLKDIYQGQFEVSDVYRNCAAALALQGLWCRYHYSSSHAPGSYAASLYENAAMYEVFLLDCLSNGTLIFESVGQEKSRLQKTEILADDPIARRYLHVCEIRGDNCGLCGKCMRTQCTLDVIGKLDNFSEVFDVPAFRSHRGWNHTWVVANRDETHFGSELYARARMTGYVTAPEVLRRKADVWLRQRLNRIGVLRMLIRIYRLLFPKPPTALR
jgi:hypothetical protein